MFPLPPYRNNPLLALSVVILAWVLLTACGFHLITTSSDPHILMGGVWIAIPAAVLSIGSMGGWLLRAEIRAVRDRRAKLEEIRPTMEVIPLERWKPPELSRWQRNRRQAVVTVSKRRVRRLPPSCPVVLRRKALGLATHRKVIVNRRRKR